MRPPLNEDDYFQYNESVEEQVLRVLQTKKELGKERARSAKLIAALKEIAKAGLTERQVAAFNPFVASNAEIARQAIAEYEAGK